MSSQTIQWFPGHMHKARKEIEDMLEQKVQLFLHVKVRDDWMERDFKEFM